jgi:hypothetical protein
MSFIAVTQDGIEQIHNHQKTGRFSGGLFILREGELASQ